MLIQYTGTSSPYYMMGLGLTVYQNDESNEYGVVEMTPYLIHKNGTTRYQHRWNIYFQVDDGPILTQSYLDGAGANALPNNSTGVDVEGPGKMWMDAGQEYQWGTAKRVLVDKRHAGSHRFKIRMECLDTIPWHCPSANDWLYVDVNFCGYKVTPSTPTAGVSFNKDTRKLTYTWNNADGNYITIERTYYKLDNYDNEVKVPTGNDYVIPTGSAYTTLSPDLGSVTDPKKVPEGVSKIYYRITNYSASGHTASSGWQSLTIDTDSKVWVKVPGVGWRKAVPWVKVPGLGWKKATKSYIKIPGVGWKRTVI